mgnify:CR=1 FL=1
MILDPDYARVFTQARIIAWQYGYACVMHGSFTRDLDLLLTPWEERACDNRVQLLKLIAQACDLQFVHGDESILKATPVFTQKPHGRTACTLYFPGYKDRRWVDISFTPCTPKGDAAGHIEYESWANSTAASGVQALHNTQPHGDTDGLATDRDSAQGRNPDSALEPVSGRTGDRAMAGRGPAAVLQAGGGDVGAQSLRGARPDEQPLHTDPQRDALDAGAAQAQGVTLPDCPRCNGAGEREVFRGDLGPDSYSELMACPDCGGTGNAGVTACAPAVPDAAQQGDKQ